MAVMLGAPRPPATPSEIRGRIAVFDAYPHLYGGAQRVARMLAQGMTGRGWTTAVLLPADGLAARQLRAGGVSVEVVAAPASLLGYGGTTTGLAAVRATAALPGYWRKLAGRLRDVDLVWAHDLRGLLLAGPAAALARRPLVWHVHADPPRYGRLRPLAARLAAHVVAPSAAALPRMPSRRATVIPNAVPIPAIAASPAEAAPIVVSVGRLHPVKGFDVLLRASAKLRESGVGHRVLVVGGSQEDQADYPQQLERLRRSLAVEDIVDFCGEVADPLPLLRSAAVYTQPSIADTLPLAALEAMAAGLPVVATTVGGLPELVADGVTGVLVEPGDADALATAVGELLADPHRRAILGAAGRRRVAAHFDETAFLDAVEQICAEFLGRRR